ncbi:MAG: hypothetical protein GXP40_09115 [Chloroflexi bacterium]|nr:hypothetical protein [Chloroflexota bacterium]
MSAQTTALSPHTARRGKIVAAIGLALIVALGAFLRLYELGAYSIGNTYYAAAVKSMLTSWHNFFFVAFEPGGSVTVDKPPLGFWVQTVSAYFLGVNGFALALPNALAGIGSILLVYHLVKKQFGVWPGLAAALVLAVVPVTVSTERNNTIDGLLVFVLLLAVWAVWKSVESGKFRYLLLGAFIVGLGFNIKMLQAYMVLPALYALYFLGAKHGWWTRLWHLGAATALLLVVSLSWAVIVDLTPAENRPFIGSSTDNTVLELIIGHNGLSRLGLNDRGPGGDGGNRPPPPVNDGQQIAQADGQPPDRPPGQLPPPNGQPPQEALDACNDLAPGDSCTVQLPNRDVDGTCLPAPQQDALVCVPAGRQPPPPPDGQFAANVPNAPDGARPDGRSRNGGPGGRGETGQAGLLRLFREPLVTEASWILPLALLGIALTALVLGWAWPLGKKHLALLLWAGWLLPEMAYFSFTTGLFHRYYLIMLGPPLAALVAITFWAVSQLWKRSRWLGWGTLTLLAAVTLGFQALVLGGYKAAGWLLPLAALTALTGLGLLLVAVRSLSWLRTAALALVLIAILAAPFTWSLLAATTQNPNVALPTASIKDAQPTTFMTPNNDSMTANEEAILAYLLANTDPDAYLLATVNARGAAPYILATGRPVLTFGGFTGGDQIIDAGGVAQMVADGELRFVLYNEQITRSHPDIAAWVRKTCTPVDVPGLETQPQPPSAAQNVRLAPPPQNEVLYDCAQ